MAWLLSIHCDTHTHKRSNKNDQSSQDVQFKCVNNYGGVYTILCQLNSKFLALNRKQSYFFLLIN